MLSLLLALSLPVAFSQEGFSYQSLVLMVYADGAVHVAETLAVEPSQPSIEAPLLGQIAQNILVTDENGTPLGGTVNGTMLVVDTLGASGVVLEYDCLDLTSKLGALWTLKVLSPVNFTLVFPANTTIVEVSQVPLEIKSLGERTALVLAPGSQEVSYVTGLFGPEAEAADAITIAQRAIEALAGQGLNLSGPTAKLDEARAAYEAQEYRLAKSMAEQALSLAYSTRDLASNATEAILGAEAAVRVAVAEGRTEGVDEAETGLANARESYQAGDYARAARLATEAQVAAERARTPFPSLTALGGVAAFAAVSISLLLYAKSRRRPAEPTVDLERLFREKPWLNPDQRRVIEFLAGKKGSAFEAEIREAGNQPKSTVWRIIKKLEDEGIVTVEQLRGQNYVTLRPRQGAPGGKGTERAEAT